MKRKGDSSRQRRFNPDTKEKYAADRAKRFAQRMWNGWSKAIEKHENGNRGDSQASHQDVNSSAANG